MCHGQLQRSFPDGDNAHMIEAEENSPFEFCFRHRLRVVEDMRCEWEVGVRKLADSAETTSEETFDGSSLRQGIRVELLRVSARG